MNEKIISSIRGNEALRASFFALAQQTFGLHFDPWYQKGYWTDRYIPYALVRGNQVLANVSVNIIDTRFGGKTTRLIQLGTVLTHPDFRAQGFARRAMEAVLADWRDRCEGVYLYANDSVLDFYPKFGFERAQEYGFSFPIAPQTGDFARLDMSLPQSVRTLGRLYALDNPYCALPMLDNPGLLFFYCLDFMKDCVYYSPSRDTVCVARHQDDVLVLYDVFGAPAAPLATLAGELSAPGVRTVHLGFTPLASQGMCVAPLVEEDTTLFVLSGKENVFARARVRMPELSRA